MLAFLTVALFVIYRNTHLTEDKTKFAIYQSQDIVQNCFVYMVIILRQGWPANMQRFWFSVLFCQAVFLFTLVYENLLTSEIIIPTPKVALDIHKYIALGKKTAQDESLATGYLLVEDLTKMGIAVPQHFLVSMTSDEYRTYKTKLGADMGIVVGEMHYNFSLQMDSVYTTVEAVGGSQLI
jgi:hypothetical protein